MRLVNTIFVARKIIYVSMYYFSALTICINLTDFQYLILNQKVLAQEQQPTQSEKRAKKIINEGTNYYNNGKLKLALQSWKKALIICRKLQIRADEVALLGNIGIVHRELGNYSLSINYLSQVLLIHKQYNNIQGQSIALENLGHTYKLLGLYNKAIEYYKKSQKITNSDDLSGQASLLSSLGSTYTELGLKNNSYDKAINSYKKSLMIAQKIGDNRLIGHIFYNLGLIYQTKNKITKAINLYDKSLLIARENKIPSLEISILNNLGMAKESLGQYKEAIDYQQQSLIIAQRIENPQQIAISLNNISHIFFELGDLAAANKSLQKAVAIWDSLFKNLNDESQISIFDTVFTYNLLQQVLVAQNKNEEALRISEHGRTRAFQSLLSKQTRLKSEALDINKVPLLEKIKKIAQIQNATIVEYTIIPEDDQLHIGKSRGSAEELYIWVVKPTGEIIFKRVDLKEHTKSSSLKRMIASTRQTLGVNNIGESESRGIIEKVLPGKIDHLKKLHQILIQPIAEHLPKNTNEKVIFVPQAELFLIPFPALKDSNDKYLIEKHTILTAPSIQTLEFTHIQKKSAIKDNFKSAVVVGNPTMPKIKNQNISLVPLPNSEEEAKNIAEKLLGKKELALITSQATETEVVKRIPNASLIHLATHGLLHETKLIAPGPPGAIALTSSQEHDGFLTAGEIINMKLKAQLAVLSACDTGIGDITGDGVVGLSRSFIAAGVPSVIVSLWQVNDRSTSDLMTEFYQQLMVDKKRNKAQALRKAMLETKKKYPNPRFWAAFTLIGES